MDMHNPKTYREYYLRNKLKILEKNERYRLAHRKEYLAYMKARYRRLRCASP